MKPAPFELHRPRTVAEAVELLATLGADGAEVKVLAGGQSLVPLLNFRLARPDHLVDVSMLDELATITVEPDRVRLGAGATQQVVADHPGLGQAAPLVVAAIDHIGHRAIRNRGTVGGSLAHADPAAELPAVAVALDATLVAVGPGGERAIPAEEFFQGWLTTDLAADEVLTEMRWDLTRPDDPDGRTEWAFDELSRRHGDFAAVLIAAVVHRDGGGVVTEARLVAGGVAPTPLRLVDAERALLGTAGLDGISGAAAAAVGEVDPPDDVHADAAYRREMVGVLVDRALRGARPWSSPAEPEAAAAPAAAGAPAGTSGDVITVNGADHPTGGVAHRRLLCDWLRDDLGLTGTHVGCEHGVCGACTVLLDGQPVRSCLTLAHQVVGHDVTTIEALGTPDELHPVQESFRTHHGLQCGFCTPAMVLSAVDLLRRRPDPDEATIREELSGVVCRCTGYVKIVESVKALGRGTDPTTR